MKFEHGSGIIEGYNSDREVYGNIPLLMNKDKTLNLEKVFIDRKLGNSLELPYLKELTLGEHIFEVQIIPSSSENLETVTCYTPFPPKCPEFTNAQYMNVTVKVPQQSLEAYQNAIGWKNFWNLQGFECTGIKNVNSDSNVTEIGRYDLNGKAITADYEGIGVIRYSDGSTKKIVVRK
ncbi:MAG: hypothetical protein HDR88_00690 [Bacteroides sp.]|nr:hypothetical protein [Bacteroides sp.]